MLETIMAVIIGIYAAQVIQFVFLTKTKLGCRLTTWVAKWSFDNSLKLFDDMEHFIK